MNRRWNWLVGSLAAVAVLVAAVAFFVRAPATPPPVVIVEDAPVRLPSTDALPTEAASSAPRGGSFDGQVVDPDGRPVADADVMLVAQGGMKRVPVEGLTESGGEPLEIPVFNAFETAARTKTNSAGNFRLTGGDARVLALFAYAKGFTPTFKAHTPEEPLVPGRNHVIQLARPGWLKGHVVDAVTKQGVPNAQVTIYLQGRANQERPGPEPFGPGNQFGYFQTWISTQVSDLVWGLKPEAFDNGFTFPTKVDGTFAFGPLSNEAQFEVVITHPEYMWSEFDPTVQFARGRGEKPDERVRRTVVPPGETVEKTFALEKGREVIGRVVERATGKPIEGVEVSLEHVAQYQQHHWYRVRARRGLTDGDGRFRIAGLSYPPYVLRMNHPSFDAEYFHNVKDGPQVAIYQLETGGWVDGRVTVEGAPKGANGEPKGTSFLADVHLQPTGDRGPTRRAHNLRVIDGTFAVEKVKPGEYSMWMVSGDLVSAPVPVTVEGDRGTTASVVLASGGGFTLDVRDRSGATIDPVSVELLALDAAGGERRAATVVARAGRAAASGMLPGKYRAMVRAVGYAPLTTDPFEILGQGVVPLPPVTLARQSWLQVGGVRDAEGRGAAGVDVHIAVAQNGGPSTPVRPLELGRIPVAAGKVTVTVVADDGRRFEETYDVEEGKTVVVEIVLKR